MRQATVRVSRPAAFDLDEIYLYIAERSPQNAELVQEAFLDVLDRLEEVPTLGHIHPEVEDDAIRFVPFKSFEVAYEHSAGIVRVLRVVHSTRDFTRVDWR